MAGNSSTYRQIMGQFWMSKPQVRLSIEYISEAYNDKRSSRRIIKYLQKANLPLVASCNVRLCEQGIV